MLPEEDLEHGRLFQGRLRLKDNPPAEAAPGARVGMVNRVPALASTLAALPPAELLFVHTIEPHDVAEEFDYLRRG